MRRCALFLLLGMVLGLILSLAARGSQAGEKNPSISTTIAIETHATSNALDRSLAVADVYQLLRGAVDWSLGDPADSLKIMTEAQASAYRLMSMENDRALAIAVERRKRFGRFELRGTIGIRAVDEGDDLIFGDAIIGIRTRSAAFSAEGEAGIDLGHGVVLVLAIADSVEKTGLTRFEENILPPEKLDADANRLRLSLALKRTSGRFVQGASVKFAQTDYETLGNPPVSVSSRSLSAIGELRFTGDKGAVLAAAIGAEAFRAANGLFEQIRPVWELAVAAPVSARVELKGKATALFETDDTDDPLASYVRRGEIEILTRPSSGVSAGFGLFGEIKDNLLFENRERANGFYAELTFEPTRNLSIVARGDFRDEVLSVLDERTRTFDAFVRVATRL